jgi:hypothetical protein
MKCGLSRIARRYSPGVRATAALSLLGPLLVVGGCGSSTGVGAGEEDTPTMTAEEPSPDSEDGGGGYTSSWWMADGQPQPGSGPPPAKELAVFQEPAKPSDEFPSSAGEDGFDYDGVPEKYRPGKELFSQARLLLAGAGAERVDLFGVPTEKGWVCLHLVASSDAMAGGGGTCIPALSEGVAFSMSGTPAAYDVFGVIANEVRGVRIVAGKRSEQAVLGRNAFFVQADPKEICPTEIESQSQNVSLNSEGTAADRDASLGCS